MIGVPVRTRRRPIARLNLHVEVPRKPPADESGWTNLQEPSWEFAGRCESVGETGSPSFIPASREAVSPRNLGTLLWLSLSPA